MRETNPFCYKIDMRHLFPDSIVEKLFPYKATSWDKKCATQYIVEKFLSDEEENLFELLEERSFLSMKAATFFMTSTILATFLSLYLSTFMSPIGLVLLPYLLIPFSLIMSLVYTAQYSTKIDKRIESIVFSQSKNITLFEITEGILLQKKRDLHLQTPDYMLKDLFPSCETSLERRNAVQQAIKELPDAEVEALSELLHNSPDQIKRCFFSLFFGVFTLMPLVLIVPCLASALFIIPSILLVSMSMYATFNEANTEQKAGGISEYRLP